MTITRDEVAKTAMLMPGESIPPLMTVSVGVAEMHAFEQEEELLAAVDFVLGRARARGRGVFSS